MCASEDLHCTYSFHDFTPTAGDAYVWSDLVIIPSIKPESFGLVAIEAMAYEKPVVAAGHSGLSEIVLPGRTGLLFANQSVESLKNAILSYMLSPEQRIQHGKDGKAKFLEYYTHKAYDIRFVAAINKQLQSWT